MSFEKDYHNDFATTFLMENPDAYQSNDHAH
jgi:hypothetical protein